MEVRREVDPSKTILVFSLLSQQVIDPKDPPPSGYKRHVQLDIFETVPSECCADNTQSIFGGPSCSHLLSNLTWDYMFWATRRLMYIP